MLTLTSPPHRRRILCPETLCRQLGLAYVRAVERGNPWITAWAGIAFCRALAEFEAETGDADRAAEIRAFVHRRAGTAEFRLAMGRADLGSVARMHVGDALRQVIERAFDATCERKGR